MRAILHTLSEILRRDYQVDGNLKLVETAAKSTCGPVTLNKSGPALALRLDGVLPLACEKPSCSFRMASNDRLFPLFRTTTAGLTAICDYIIFYPFDDQDESRLFVFLCELKSGDPRGASKQAENGLLLAEYLVAMARHHGRLSQSPTLAYRGLIFSPRLAVPRIGNPRLDRCSYQPANDALRGLRHAYCRDGEYPLAYFCA